MAPQQDDCHEIRRTREKKGLEAKWSSLGPAHGCGKDPVRPLLFSIPEHAEEGVFSPLRPPDIILRPDEVRGWGTSQHSLHDDAMDVQNFFSLAPAGTPREEGGRGLQSLEL